MDPESAPEFAWINTKLSLIVQKIGMVTSDSSQKYTTHCFRRGGAQHRFFYAKKRWNLTAVRAWGGWAHGESPKTIIRYLMDEYIAMEQNFSDLMSPERTDRNYSIISQDTGLPDISSVVRDINDKLDAISDKIDSIATSSMSSQSPQSPQITQSVSDNNHEHFNAKTNAPVANHKNQRRRGRPRIPRTTKMVTRIPATKNLDELLELWNVGFPARNIPPLKDMSIEDRRTSTSIRSQFSKRKCVISKVEELGKDRFLTLFGHCQTITQMYDAISRQSRDN